MLIKKEVLNTSKQWRRTTSDSQTDPKLSVGDKSDDKDESSILFVLSVSMVFFYNEKGEATIKINIFSFYNY